MEILREWQAFSAERVEVRWGLPLPILLPSACLLVGVRPRLLFQKCLGVTVTLKYW